MKEMGNYDSFVGNFQTFIEWTFNELSVIFKDEIHKKYSSSVIDNLLLDDQTRESLHAKEMSIRDRK